MFQENKFKVEIIRGLPQDATISLYRCGPMVRPCSGSPDPLQSVCVIVLDHDQPDGAMHAAMGSSPESGEGCRACQGQPGGLTVGKRR